ncbi:MAG: amidohydrolase [Treponema sp.]|nr:amidohydrolase [Treponema sp.]
MLDYVTSKSKEIEKKTIARRRDLHKHAEAGWTEFRTAALAIKELEKMGYTIKMGKDVLDKSQMMGVPATAELEKHQQRAIAQGADPELVKKMTGGMTAFTAEMKFSDDGPALGFRIDMDSNDVTETKDNAHIPIQEGFSSINNGAMHACGHDAHMAIGLAVAEIVAGMKGDLKGSVRFIFQPAEEGLRGAAPMVAAGVVKGLDHIMGMHIGIKADKTGNLVCGTKGFLASTKWDVTINGKGAHAGAAPQDGHNALLAGAVASINLHAISRHGDGTTRINVGKMVAGEGRNVIPPKALLVMETRGITSELNNYMVEQSERIIKAACDMYNCTYSIEVTGGSQSGDSSQEMIDLVYETAQEIPHFTKIEKLRDLGGGEDYSQMMSEVQKAGGIGTYVQIGSTLASGAHTSTFDLDESNLTPAAELMSYLVYKVLKK